MSGMIGMAPIPRCVPAVFSWRIVALSTASFKWTLATEIGRDINSLTCNPLR